MNGTKHYVPPKNVTLKEWFLSCHSLPTIEDIVMAGFKSGHPFTRVRETQYQLCKRFQPEMWELLAREADKLAITPLELLQNYTERSDLRVIRSYAEYVYMLTSFTIETLANEIYGEED